MPKMHIKKDDTVLILAGKDEGKKGKVLGVEPKKGRVTVDGVNVVRRHTKPRPPRFPQGGIIEKTLPVDISNVMLVCPECGKPSRTGSKTLENGTRVRVCKKCEAQV